MFAIAPRAIPSQNRIGFTDRIVFVTQPIRWLAKGEVVEQVRFINQNVGITG